MYAQIIATIRCFYRSWLRWLLDSSSVLQPRICDRWSLYQTLNSRHHGTWFRMIPNESMILMQWLMGQAPSHSHSSPAGIGCILCFQLSRRSSSMMDSFLMTRRRLLCFGQDMHKILGGAASHLYTVDFWSAFLMSCLRSSGHESERLGFQRASGRGSRLYCGNSQRDQPHERGWGSNFGNSAQNRTVRKTIRTTGTSKNSGRDYGRCRISCHDAVSRDCIWGKPCYSLSAKWR